jgi:hypothetical protein
VGQERFARRLVELSDVRAADEVLAAPMNHDRLNALVLVSLLEGGEQPHAHGLAERIDRRIVDDDDRYVSVAVESDRGAHGSRSMSIAMP